MSTSTATETKPVKVAETAKPAKAPRTRKPAANQPQPTVDVVNHDDGTTSDEVKATYVAVASGRGGKRNVRRVPTMVSHAVDVADPDGRTPTAKAGLIYRFFATQAKADEFAAKKNADGLDAIVVPVESCRPWVGADADPKA